MCAQSLQSTSVKVDGLDKRVLGHPGLTCFRLLLGRVVRRGTIKPAEEGWGRWEESGIGNRRLPVVLCRF